MRVFFLMREKYILLTSEYTDVGCLFGGSECLHLAVTLQGHLWGVQGDY